MRTQNPEINAQKSYIVAQQSQNGTHLLSLNVNLTLSNRGRGNHSDGTRTKVTGAGTESNIHWH